MSPVSIRKFDTAVSNPEELRLLLSRPALEDITPSQAVLDHTAKVFGQPLKPVESVRKILEDVEAYGDSAVIDYTERIDGVKLTPDALFVDEDEWSESVARVAPEVMQTIKIAAERIRRFHQNQVERSWFMETHPDEILGQRVLPLERVACYVPGGRAPLVSTAIMSVVPAKVAGVQEVIAATPCDREGKINPYVLAALKEAGADRVLRVGGAQAIAALAFGTTWIPKVDKIVGPGNLFVTLAKKAVFGQVGIDALNGPSEVVIIADDSADPKLVAADLLSQAEHDPEAAALLITPDRDLAARVEAEINRQLPAVANSRVAKESLERWGAIIISRDIDESAFWVNVVAPEHVQLIVREPWQLLPSIRFAGAVFLGSYAPVPLGDYIAGPNHILPTNGTARYASPLGVYDFVRRSSVVYTGPDAFHGIAPHAAALARVEGLIGHAESLELRDQTDKE